MVLNPHFTMYQNLRAAARKFWTKKAKLGLYMEVKKIMNQVFEAYHTALVKDYTYHLGTIPLQVNFSESKYGPSVQALAFLKVS